MREYIVISEHSQALIKKYLETGNVESNKIQSYSSPVLVSHLVELLHDDISIISASKKINQETKFLLASLRAALLHDLFISLGQEKPSENHLKSIPSKTTKGTFILLAVAGSLFAICEGFDSITTMMGTFSLPSLAVFLTGIFFSVLSLCIFYSLDLIQLSGNLGIKLRDAPKILDLYLLQMKEIKAIRRKVDSYSLSHLSTNELIQLESILIMLQKNVYSLLEVGTQFSSALNSKGLIIAKNIFSGISGVLFFAGGFCAGQTVSVFILSMIMTGITPISWPVILFSVVVGLAALTLYWSLERGNLKKTLSAWVGLDEDKVHQLCDKDVLDKEVMKLESLKEKIISTSLLTQHLEQLQHPIIGISETSSAALIRPTPVESRISTNLYAFHAKPSVQKGSSECELYEMALNI